LIAQLPNLMLQPFTAPRSGLIHLCSQFIALALQLRA
jgi:hypothetical protein